MMTSTPAWLLFLSVVLLPASAAHGDDLYLPGESDILENPSVVTGFNKATNVLTGSISAIRTAPGRTDECRILFSGIVKEPASISVRFFDDDAADGGQSVSRVEKAAVVQDGAHWRLTLDKTRLAGGCEWILPFVGEPSVREHGKTLSISIPKRTAGDWIAVHAIKSARAYFYKAPGESQAQKAFLVAGDTAYVYEERLNWMYVKFQGRKNLTSGWIKKSDTVQF